MEKVYREYLGNMIALPVGETLVGRDVDCPIRLNDDRVSRHHARVVRRGPEVFVEDLESRNGTYINGRALTTAVSVRDGDVIMMSTCVLTVRANGVERAKRATLVQGSDPVADLAIARAITNREIKTQPIAITGNKRCPQCGHEASRLDDECATCAFSWRRVRNGVQRMPTSRACAGTGVVRSR